jgi:hypothetical protein
VGTDYYYYYYYYYYCLHSLRERRHHRDALFLFRSIMVLNPALPSLKMLAFVFLPEILGTFHCLVFYRLINTVLLGAPMLPTRWVKISTYLQSEPFLSITYILINLKLLILFVHNPNVLCYIVLVTRPHFFFFFFSINVFFLQHCPLICLWLYAVFFHNVITCMYTVRCL